MDFESSDFDSRICRVFSFTNLSCLSRTTQRFTLSMKGCGGFICIEYTNEIGYWRRKCLFMVALRAISATTLFGSAFKMALGAFTHMLGQHGIREQNHGGDQNGGGASIDW